MYRAVCSNCGKSVELRQGSLEQIIACPQCGACITIPPDPSQVSDVLPSSENDKKRNVVSWKWIIVGLILPLSLLLVGHIFLNQILFFTWWFFLIGGFLFFVIFYIFCLLVYPIYVLQRTKQKSLFVKMNALQIFKELCISFLFFVFVYLVLCFLSYLLVDIFKSEIPVSETKKWLAQAGYLWSKIILFLLAVTFVPVAEEIYFRGFLYTSLKTRMHAVGALFLQAVFFSLLHLYNLAGSIVVFVIGILLAFIYERRKTIYAPIFVHGFINTAALLPLLILMFMNTHRPAQTWDQAEQQPQWLSVTPPAYVQKQETAEAQRLYAIQTWGSQGWHLWKKEINALRAVEYWFPEETEECAMARYGVIEVYFQYLRDYRRAAVEADNLLALYPQHREICSWALLDKAWVCYFLGDFDQSKDTVEYILAEYGEFEPEKEGAEQLLVFLRQVGDVNDLCFEYFIEKSADAER